MKLNMRRINKTGMDQKGFASIVIALILVTLLSLMTVAFSQLSRREQKSSLDKQLATQAYYAAETGINDVEQKITNRYAKGDDLPFMATVEALLPDNCLTSAQMGAYGLTQTIDAYRGISYSCIIVDVRPPDLRFANAEPENEKSTTFSVSGTLTSLRINWGSHSPQGKVLRSAKGFTPKSSWNSPAVLEVLLTPVGDGSRQGLIDRTFVTYMYPVDTSWNPTDPEFRGSRGTVSYVNNSDAGQAKLSIGDCNMTREYACFVEITGIPDSANGYLVRMIPHYDRSKIKIDEAENLSGVKLEFTKGQAKIDVTGRARDVLKRVQVRAPINPPADTPDYVVEAKNFCKRMTTEPGSTSYTPYGTGGGCTPSP